MSETEPQEADYEPAGVHTRNDTASEDDDVFNLFPVMGCEGRYPLSDTDSEGVILSLILIS